MIVKQLTELFSTYSQQKLEFDAQMNSAANQQK